MIEARSDAVSVMDFIVALAFGDAGTQHEDGGWLLLARQAGLSRRIVTEDIEMFARKDAFLSVGRGALLAAVAALALAAIGPSAASAGSASPDKGLSARHAVTDFSARGRYHHGYHHADRYETAVYRRNLDGPAELERRHAYWEAYNAYYGGGAVYDDHGPFYAEFGGYGSNVPPYLWGPSPYAWW